MIPPESYAQYSSKLDSYAALFAAQNAAKGKSVHAGQALVHAAFYLMKNYLCRGGFLDAKQGFYYHWLHARYVWMKYKLLSESPGAEKPARNCHVRFINKFNSMPLELPPRLLRLIELQPERLLASSFLAGALARDRPAQHPFRKVVEKGVAVQSCELFHRYLQGVAFAAQRQRAQTHAEVLIGARRNAIKRIVARKRQCGMRQREHRFRVGRAQGLARRGTRARQDGTQIHIPRFRVAIADDSQGEVARASGEQRPDAIELRAAEQRFESAPAIEIVHHQFAAIRGQQIVETPKHRLAAHGRVQYRMEGEYWGSVAHESSILASSQRHPEIARKAMRLPAAVDWK